MEDLCILGQSEVLESLQEGARQGKVYIDAQQVQRLLDALG